MFEVSVTAFAAAVFKPSVRECSHQFADLGWHGQMVPLWYRFVHATDDPAKLLRPVQRTELVAVRVAHIGQVHGTLLALAETGWILDRRASVGNRRVVELPHLLRRTALEADGPAVRGSGRLAVDRFADTEGSTVVPVEQTGRPVPLMFCTGAPTPSTPSTAS